MGLEGEGSCLPTAEEGGGLRHPLKWVHLPGRGHPLFLRRGDVDVGYGGAKVEGGKRRKTTIICWVGEGTHAASVQPL